MSSDISDIVQAVHDYVRTDDERVIVDAYNLALNDESNRDVNKKFVEAFAVAAKEQVDGLRGDAVAHVAWSLYNRATTISRSIFRGFVHVQTIRQAFADAGINLHELQTMQRKHHRGMLYAVQVQESDLGNFTRI
jgi:hypothetical protein